MRRIDDRASWSGALGALGAFTAASVFAFLLVPLSARRPFGELMARSSYRTWQMLLLLQALLWIGSVAYALHVRRESRRLVRDRRADVLQWIWLTVLVAFPFLFLQLPVEGTSRYYEWGTSTVGARYFLATGAGLLAAAIVGSGMLRLHAIGQAWLERDPAGQPEEGAELLRDLNAHLEKHLVALAAILAAAVVGTEASRLTILDFERVSPMPREQVMQWGLYWSALLGALYCGIRVTLHRVGQRVRLALLAESDTGETWRERDETGRKLDESLDLNRSLATEIQSVTKVLAPVVGALASMLL